MPSLYFAVTLFFLASNVIFAIAFVLRAGGANIKLPHGHIFHPCTICSVDVFACHGRGTFFTSQRQHPSAEATVCSKLCPCTL